MNAELCAQFERVAGRTRALLEARQIEAVAGCWHESAVLKLQKRRWSNTAPAAGPGESGLFFSVWANDEGLRQKRVFYNIHALKLRALSGYSLQSREFAAAFRAAFEAEIPGWPHCTVDFGPQTLMQGWIAWEPARLEDEVEALVKRFVPLAELLDRLLDARTAPGRPKKDRGIAPSAA